MVSGLESVLLSPMICFVSMQVVISPHLYPPSITKSTWLGANLWKQSNTSFAYLQYRGFCEAEHCTKFPIVIGEAGSALDSTKQDDSVWLQDFANFVMAKVSSRLMAALFRILSSGLLTTRALK